MASEKWMRHVSVAFTLMNLEAEQHKCEHRATKKKGEENVMILFAARKKRLKNFKRQVTEII